MATRDWKNRENLRKLAYFIAYNKIDNINTKVLKDICKYLDINERKCNGTILNHTKIRVMFLHARRFLISRSMGINSLNMARAILFNFLETKQDLLVIQHRISEYTHIDQNVYIGNPEDFGTENLAEMCSCSAEEKCGFNSNCCNRYESLTK